MKSINKALIIVLMVVIWGGLFSEIDIKANQNKAVTTTISVKRINKKTGVRVIIGKLGKEGEYRIYISGCGKSYKGYKDAGERLIAKGSTDGTEIINYTINGLPEGKYTFRVGFREKVSVTYVDMGEKITYYYLGEMVYSKSKSVKIIKGSTKHNTENTSDFSKVKQGEIIKFGAYEQDDDMLNGREPIEWIVLYKNKKEITLLSKYALDFLPYDINYDNENIEWKLCSLRKWLNEFFYNDAFSKVEKERIKETELITNDNETKDKIYVLTKADLDNKYIEECYITNYSRIQRGYHEEYKEDTCYWWLREKIGNAIACCYYTHVPYSSAVGIRPVITIKY